MSRLREEQEVALRIRHILPLLVAAAVMLTACATAPPNRRSQVDDLAQQIRTLPGVAATSYTFGDGGPKGPAFFEVDVDVDVVVGITGDQVAAITDRYLADLKSVDYSGYRAELDIHDDDDVFVVPTGGRPADNGAQIGAQAHNWVALRQRFPDSTVKLRSTIEHTGTAPLLNAGSIELADAADYTAVAAAVNTLATSFADLAAGDWTISAGNQRPAEIRSSRRLPNAQEMQLWTTLNADQSIPYADVLVINNPVTGPVWVSERIAADDSALAIRLAQRHLPLVARLPAPVVYTASNQYQGHIGYHGEATAPVMVTVGGCTKRSYRPSPAEQALIDQYEKCRQSASR